MAFQATGFLVFAALEIAAARHSLGSASKRQSNDATAVPEQKLEFPSAA